MSHAHEVALDTRNDLKKYGNNAHLLFALELRFQIEDIHTVAANSLTDGSDDKKCDLIYVNSDDGYIVVAQGYFGQNAAKLAAPANKATDLNTAAAWLFTRPINELPERLRSAAAEVRSALEDNSIRYIQFWYVHNLPESDNVGNELRTVENTINNALSVQFANSEVIEVSAIEVGVNILEEWYQALQTPILVSKELSIPIPGGYSISGDDWHSFVTSVPISWLHSTFTTYKDRLFSANVRGYLGSRQSSSNINHGIKKTATDDPSHFWVFNNGLTVLVHDFNPTKDADGNEILQIQGISIVNGAQTTGAIGSLGNIPNSEGMVQTRFVKCGNKETIQRIIEYNNRQNVVEASDFRSNDIVQRRLREEFQAIPDAKYLGGRRGGHEDVIRRSPYLIPSDTAAQALAAFHQDPIVAYNQKSQIWISDSLYSRYFSEQTHAEHIVFVYSLLRSVEAKKVSLIGENNERGQLPDASAQQLNFLRHRGATFLLTAAIAKCLETFLGQAIPNVFRTSFGVKTSPQVGQELWNQIIVVTIPFCEQLLPAVRNGLKNTDDVNQAMKTFKSLVEAVKVPNAETFKQFASRVHIAN